MTPLVDNASHAGQQRRAKRLQRTAEDQLRADTEHLLADPAFRRWVGWLLAVTELFQFEASTEHLQFASGQRSIATRVCQQLDAVVPSADLQIRTERRQAEHNDAIVREALAAEGQELDE